MDHGQVQYTTIERTFNFELTFIKICGGFMFEWAKFIGIIYRLGIIIVAKCLDLRQYASYPQEFEAFSKTAWQNVRLFWYSYHIISQATVLVNLLTGIRYHNLILLVLRKRFDVRYLTAYVCDGAESSRRSPSSGQLAPPENNWSNIPDNQSNRSLGGVYHQDEPATSSSPTLSLKSGNDDSSGSILKMNSREAGHGANKSGGFRTTSRVKAVRLILIANLLLATLSFHLMELTYSRFRVKKVEPPPGNSSLSILPTISLPHAVSPDLVSPSSVRSLFRQPLSAFKLNTSPRVELNHRREKQQLQYKHKHQHQHHQLTNPNANWRRWLSNGSGLSEWLRRANFLPPKVSRAILFVGYIMFAFMQAALNINQTYGQLLVVLMVTATITDMLSYSCAHDGLIPQEEKDQMNNNNKYNIMNPGMLDTRKQSRQNKRGRRRPLLTTELLVQARDVLIVLRHCMSLNYLMLLIFDSARLMGNFCLFNAAITTGRFDTIILIFIDYLAIGFSMSLTRLGYHWLHDQVRRLKRMVDEKNSLLIDGANIVNNMSASKYNNITLSSANNNIISGDARDNSLDMGQSERITTSKLAEHISDLWPTDWFIPDLKGYLKHNIFVITFVATLQQLVEAGSKFEHQRNNMSK